MRRARFHEPCSAAKASSRYSLRELLAGVEGHAERRRVRLDEHVGHDHLVLQLGVLALVARVLVGAEVIPGPAVEAAFLDVGDVVGHQVVAQRVALVDRGPELAGLGVDRQADGVADARGVDPLVLAVGVEGQDVGPALLALVVADVRPRADRNEQGLAVLRELEVAGPVAAAADLLAAAGDVLDDDLGRPARLGVAVLVGEADDGVGIADVDVRRVGPGRIEGDPERPASGPWRRPRSVSALPSPSASRSSLMRPGMLSATKMSPLGAVTILRGLLQAGGELGDLEALGSTRHGPVGPADEPGEIVGRGRVEGLRQVVEGDPASDARRVGRPVAEGLPAGQNAGRRTRTVGPRRDCQPHDRDARGDECEEKGLGIEAVGHEVLSRLPRLSMMKSERSCRR